MGLIVGQGAAFVAAGAAAELVTPAAVIAIAGGLGAVAALMLAFSWRRVAPPAGATLRRGAPPMPRNEEARCRNAAPGNDVNGRTPLKSTCRALRFPLGCACWAGVGAQVHATRIICLPPSGRRCRPCSPSPTAARRVIVACQTPFSPSLSGDVR